MNLEGFQNYFSKISFYLKVLFLERKRLGNVMGNGVPNTPLVGVFEGNVIFHDFAQNLVQFLTQPLHWTQYSQSNVAALLFRDSIKLKLKPVSSLNVQIVTSYFAISPFHRRMLLKICLLRLWCCKQLYKNIKLFNILVF